MGGEVGGLSRDVALSGDGWMKVSFFNNSGDIIATFPTHINSLLNRDFTLKYHKLSEKSHKVTRRHKACVCTSTQTQV